jgi:phosphoribosylformylglycinamidine synthase subunit PurS
MNWLARVYVLPKAEVLDPQGAAILSALHHLGLQGVGDVRSGRLFDLRVTADDRDSAERLVGDACERLLANTVVETYSYDLQPIAEPAEATR